MGDRERAATIIDRLTLDEIAFLVHATDPTADHEEPGWCSGLEWCAGVTFHQQKRAELFVEKATEQGAS